MPPITWFEGLLDYFDTELSQGNEERQAIGHSVGRQIIGLYVIEVILKHAFEQEGQPYPKTRNLLELFKALSETKRAAAELKYRQILHDEVVETWDFAETVSEFLMYLGNDAMTESRYFWEREHSPGRSILFLPQKLRPLMYALFIALHDYPEGHEFEQHYETKYISLAESFRERDEREENEPRLRDGPRKNKNIKPIIFWLEGLLAYFLATSPREADDLRRLGFALGRRIIGLYLVEMILKYALDDADREFTRKHNLRALFDRLPWPTRRTAQNEYTRLLEKRSLLTTGIQIDLGRSLADLGNDPITEVRYFWEPTRTPIVLSPGPLVPVIYALLTAFHGYPSK